MLAIEEQPDEHAEQEDDVLDEDGEVAVAFWAGQEGEVDHDDEDAQQHYLDVDDAAHIGCQPAAEVAR